MKMKFVVITENGKVIGTHSASDSPREGAVARLVAGPGQQAHEVEVEISAPPSTSKVIDEFHQSLEKIIGSRGKT